MILDGSKLSREIAAKLKRKIKRLKGKLRLFIVQIGNLSASNRYIERKKIFAAKIGAIAESKKFPSNISRKRLDSIISKLNNDKAVHGIIVQEPLPKHLQNISGNIAEEKKVDGGKYFIPATTKGILTLLKKYKVKIAGKKLTVVGRSNLVGLPTALEMLKRDATVTICHRKTENLKEETKRADILIVAAGRPKLISKNHVSRNQVVIDIGINVLKNGKLCGDVDFKNVSKIVKAISPVPGGVGPMTVASLFENLLEAHKLQS